MAIVEVVKYNGSSDIFAWKFPGEALATWSQLIVNESQEAVLIKDGKVYDVFESGRYKLSTANIPLLNKVISLPFGGRSLFTAEVWFINKAYNLSIKWGTASPIQIQDSKYGIFVPVRANGMFGIQIADSKKFMIKLVGILRKFDKASVSKYFRGLYVTKVKDAISTYLIHKGISILEINAHINELSEYMKEKIMPEMDEFGISLVNFFVNEISMPEDDTAVIRLKDALSKRAEMNIIGYSYQQERSFDTLEGAAKNNGSSSSFMGAGVGLGMGLGMGKVMGTNFEEISKEVTLSNSDKSEKECPKCHSAMQTTQRFCSVCGYDSNGKKEEVLKCSSCNSEINKNTKFCPECGRKINHCPQCGNDLADGIDKCSSCGYELSKICPNCGNEVSPKVKFCPECGEKL